MTTQEKQNQYIMGTYGRFPVVLEQGKQESCQDETGKQYIDFGSGIGTNSLRASTTVQPIFTPLSSIPRIRRKHIANS